MAQRKKNRKKQDEGQRLKRRQAKAARSKKRPRKGPTEIPDPFGDAILPEAPDPFDD